MRRRTPEFQRGLRRYRLDVCDSANAVGAKDFFLVRHVCIQNRAALPVNRKVTAPACLTCLRPFAIVIGEENALIVQTKQRRPRQRKLLQYRYCAR